MNETAFSVVAQATGEAPKSEPRELEPDRDTVSAVMAAMGRRGGLKGGRSRAAKLSAEERSEIASTAAMARWKKARAGRAK